MSKKNNVEEQIEETVPEVSAEVPEEIIISEEENELTVEPVVEPEIEIGVPIDEPLPKIEFVNEPIEIKIDVIPQRTIESLNRDELRYYQRTGRMPQ